MRECNSAAQNKFSDTLAYMHLPGRHCAPRGVKQGHFSDKEKMNQYGNLAECFWELESQAEGDELPISEMNQKGNNKLHRIKNLRSKKKNLR